MTTGSMYITVRYRYNEWLEYRIPELVHDTNLFSSDTMSYFREYLYQKHESTEDILSKLNS